MLVSARAFCALFFGLSLSAATAQGAASPVVQTTFGPVQGATDVENTYAYKGIPFAAPPVAALRWRAPTDPKPWSQTLQTTQFSASCLQMDSNAEAGYSGSEDCLYLNVWRPSSESVVPRPVMVWIHGGGNTSGAASFGLYDGAQLAARGDVILVSIQYRLSFMGWFQEPAVHSGNALDDSGNFGLLDQIKALKWVRDNISGFGGDPSRVTIFGESAGGMNSWSLMISPQASGLFHRAIIQSGCPLYIPYDQARATAQSIAQTLIVADGLATADQAAAYIASQGDAWLKSYLYGKPAEEILVEVDAAGQLGMLSFYSSEDGVVLPTDALGTLSRGEYRGVPTIVGSNRDEMKLFYFPMYPMKTKLYNEAMSTMYGDQVDEIEALYPARAYTQPFYYNRFSDIGDGWLELICALDGASMASAHQNVWMYSFRFDELIQPYDSVLGAAHAAELPFLFGHFSDQLYGSDTQAQREMLSSTMMKLWSCMANTGDPSACTGLPQWTKFSTAGSDAYNRLVLDTAITQTPMTRQELQQADYWNSQGGLELRMGNAAGLDVNPLVKLPLKAPSKRR